MNEQKQHFKTIVTKTRQKHIFFYFLFYNTAQSFLSAMNSYHNQNKLRN